jgi:hypothetical protein
MLCFISILIFCGVVKWRARQLTLKWYHLARTCHVLSRLRLGVLRLYLAILDLCGSFGCAAFRRASVATRLCQCHGGSHVIFPERTCVFARERAPNIERVSVDAVALTLVRCMARAFSYNLRVVVWIWGRPKQRMVLRRWYDDGIICLIVPWTRN